jgi:hypothetical protein
MRYIAIVFVDEVSHNYDDYSEIVKSITDWTQVTEEQYQILARPIPWEVERKLGGRRFRVLERPADEPKFVLDTVADFIKAYEQIDRERKEREAEEKRKREEKAERKRVRRLENDRERLKGLIAANPDLVQEVIGENK